MDMIELGREISAKRKKLGVSQQTLATSNRMSRATISNLENGKLAELGLRKFLAICTTLALTLEVKEINARPTLRELIEENKNA